VTNNELSADLTLNVKSFSNNTELDSEENHDYNDLREKIYKIYGNNNNLIKDSNKNKIYKKREMHQKFTSILDFVIYESQRKQFLILCFIWFSQDGIYDGLAVFLKNLDGNIYNNGCILYTLDIIAFVLAGFLMNIKCLGRVKAMGLMYLVSLVGYIFLVFDNDVNKKGTWQTSFALGARFAISSIFTIVYSYTAEVYPVVLSTKGFCIHWTFSKMGSIVAFILLEFLGQSILFVMGVCNLVCLVLVMFLPETYGKEKLEDIPEKLTEELKTNN